MNFVKDAADGGANNVIVEDVDDISPVREADDVNSVQDVVGDVNSEKQADDMNDNGSDDSVKFALSSAAYDQSKLKG